MIFEEIGLAELSKDNPLKVLHSKLEIESINYGFIGISNWRIDASKMNRTLYLARPDPKENELKTFNFEIKNSFNSRNKNKFKFLSLINTLSNIYIDLINFKEKKEEDIFGLRDYYSLIKGIFNDYENSY